MRAGCCADPCGHPAIMRVLSGRHDHGVVHRARAHGFCFARSNCEFLRAERITAYITVIGEYDPPVHGQCIQVRVDFRYRGQLVVERQFVESQIPACPSQ